jgi:thymidine phosphorylase
VDDPRRLPRAPRTLEVPSPRDGFVAALDAYAVGETVVRMGGGRLRKEEDVDPAVGIVLAKKTGDGVHAGEPLAVLHVRDDGRAAAASLLAGYRIGARAPAPRPLVLERLAAGE